MKNLKNKFVKLSLAATMFAVGANALNLDGAVYIALHKNHDLQAQRYDFAQSVENVKINDANYLPKLDLSYSYNKRDKVSGTSSKEDGTFTTALSYNLFNGLKDEASIKSSKYLSKSSKYTLEALKHDIALNTKKAYINYLDKVNEQETYEVEYTLFEKQYIDAKNRYEQGLMSRNDLLQVQVNMSSAKQNVVRAKANVKVAKLQLSNILGGMDLSGEKIEKLRPIDVKLTKYNKDRLDDRSEIEALKMTLESLKQQQNVSKGNYYPKVDATLSHNRFYEDLGFNEVDGTDNQNVANLSATWNLFNGKRDQTQVKIYNLQMSKLKAQIQKTKLDINLQFEDAKANLDVANDNYETASLALEQAKENYNIVQNRFNEGISTSTDLTDANFLLTSAKQRFNRAYFDKFLATATLERIFEIL